MKMLKHTKFKLTNFIRALCCSHIQKAIQFIIVILFCGYTNGNWWKLADESFDIKELYRENRTYEVCDNTNFFTNYQRDVCMNNPELVKVFINAAQIAKLECQSYFQNSRWNCSTKKDNEIIYGNLDTIGNRETAYLNAINSASLAWTITRYCSKGELTQCSCDRMIRKKHSKWQWGGCSEDVNHGIKYSRNFIDSLENGVTKVGLMNLHNNEAARRTLRSKMQKVCKCHGMSGSCSVRVCWRRLPTMRMVTESLGQMYDGAALVKPIEKDGRIIKLRRKDAQFKKINKFDLIYLGDSPDYCDENEDLGIFGTKGRFCNRTSYGIEGCRLLCCGRGYQTRTRYVEEKCNCKFVWCCAVKCEMCVVRKDEFICN